MSVTVKYYRVTNHAGVVSKDIGWHISRTARNVVVQEVNGVATVVKDESIPQEFDRFPRSENRLEITKEEYDALDVSSETSGQYALRSGSEVTLLKVQGSDAQTLDVAEFVKTAQAGIDARRGR